jgi:hypothetical protein
MPLLQYFRRPVLSADKERQLLSELHLALPELANKVTAIRSEYCFYVQCTALLDETRRLTHV